MGAWGVKPFENDDAADFVYQVESDGLDAILAGLDAAATADYCEADQGAQAVAAAALAASPRYGRRSWPRRGWRSSPGERSAASAGRARSWSTSGPTATRPMRGMP